MDDGKIPKNFIFLGIFLSPLLVSFIIVFVLLGIKEYNDGNFNDFYNNWKEGPITSITLVDDENVNDKNYISLSEYNGKNLYKWKGKTFKIERSKTNYFKSFPKKKTKEMDKECGIDSFGNKLYYPFKEECPINYIEFSKNKIPYLNNKNIKTLKFNDSDYLHFSNEFVEGKILVDFVVSDHYGPCSNSKYSKNINSFFNVNQCNDIILDYSYINLDKESFNDFKKDNKINENGKNLANMNNIYLYGRTYIANNNLDKDYSRKTDIKLIEGLKSYTSGKNVFSIFAFIIIIIYIISHFINTKKDNHYLFLWGILSIICCLIMIILNAIDNSKYHKLKKNFLKFIIHQVSESYCKKNKFMKLNDSILSITIIIFMILIFIFLILNKDNKNYVLNNIFICKSDEVTQTENGHTIDWCRSKECCLWDKQININHEIKKKINGFDILKYNQNELSKNFTHYREEINQLLNYFNNPNYKEESKIEEIEKKINKNPQSTRSSSTDHN